MIDMIGLYIPFRADTFGFSDLEKIQYDSGLYDKTSRAKVFDIVKICRSDKLPLNLYDVAFEYEEMQVSSRDGSDSQYFDVERLIATGLNVPYEQLESAFSGIALKINHSPTIGIPHIQLKASPAKLLMGHNVFGYDDIESGIIIMLYTLLLKCPTLCQYLDFSFSEIRMLDITYSFKMRSESEVLYVLDYLRNVSYGQTKARKAHYDSTIYFGSSDSKHKFLRLYYKHAEILKTLNSKSRQIKNNINETQLDILSDEDLLKYAENLLRVEAALRKEWILKKFGSTLLRDVLLSDVSFGQVWVDAMSDLFKAVGDVSFKNQSDEEIRSRINEAYVTINQRTGKESFTTANNIYAFYRLIVGDGYTAVKNTTAESTFKKRVKQLEAIGLSRAHLQNYTSEDNNSRNVIPFIKIVDLTNVVSPPIPMPDYRSRINPDYLRLIDDILRKAV